MTTTTLPTTTRTWQYTTTRGGLAPNLFLNPTSPIPTPSPTQHLVRIFAVALNPVDYKPAEVALVHRFLIPKPATPGIDFVGRIIVPATSSSLKAGQMIFGCGGTNPFNGGMLTEYGIVDKDTSIALPDGVDPIDAATIGVAGVTAYQAIVGRVKAGSNARILVNGGSGGCGIFCIQIARALGYEVTATCSGRNVELCRSLGAEVIDYTKGPVLESIKKSAATGRKYDLVVDNVFSNPQLYWKAHEYTNSGATYVVVAGSPSLQYMSTMFRMRYIPGFLGGGRRKIESFLAEPKMDQLGQIGEWVAQKTVKAVIDERFPFEKAADAFRKLKTGRAVGKIVVDVQPVSE